MTNAGTCTVRFSEALEVPSLNNACGTLTFALAGDVNLFAGGEYVCFNEIAYIISVRVVKTELFKSFLGSYACFVKNPFIGFVTLWGFKSPYPI